MLNANCLSLEGEVLGRWANRRKEDTFFFSLFWNIALKSFPKLGRETRQLKQKDSQSGNILGNSRCWIGESNSSTTGLARKWQALFHAELTLKVIAFQFSPGECRITLAIREKEWGLSLKKKHTWKAIVGVFKHFLTVSYLHSWKCAGWHTATNLAPPPMLGVVF